MSSVSRATGQCLGGILVQGDEWMKAWGLCTRWSVLIREVLGAFLPKYLPRIARSMMPVCTWSQDAVVVQKLRSI